MEMAPRGTPWKSFQRGHRLTGARSARKDKSSMQTFAKPQEAREVEARARARTLGVKVAVLVHGRRYCSASQSRPGTLHAVERTRVGWACSCEGYEFTGCCKHLAAV